MPAMRTIAPEQPGCCEPVHIPELRFQRKKATEVNLNMQNQMPRAKLAKVRNEKEW
jgi:hypothetical protein